MIVKLYNAVPKTEYWQTQKQPEIIRIQYLYNLSRGTNKPSQTDQIA